MDNSEKLIKKAAVVGINVLIGGVLAGGMGALIGAVSSLDHEVINSGVDKILEKEDNALTENLNKDTSEQDV